MKSTLWINREGYAEDFVMYLEEVRITFPLPVSEIDFATCPLPFETPPHPPQIFYQAINQNNNEQT